ncbi:MAG: hypothetical protein ACI4LO_02300 [Anaerovoracaceae bacterium]
MDFKQIEKFLDEHFIYLQGTLGKESLPLLEAEGRFFAGGEENETLKCLKGKRIGAKETGELATEGEVFVEVYKKPSVSLISVGDEWISAFEEEYEGKERDRNSYMTAVLTKESGADTAGISLVKSNSEELENALSEALEKSNIAVLYGKDNEQNCRAVTRVLEKYDNPGTVYAEEVTLDLDKEQRERLSDYKKGSLVSITRDTHCCCHIKNNLIVWLAGDPDMIMSGFRSIVTPFLEKYYFG